MPGLEKALQVAVHAATAAGEILRAGLSDPNKGEAAKTHANDPVTEYDRRADEAIAAALTAGVPDVPILSEEGDGTARAAPRRWVVDPLDWTNNFVRSLPHISVSIALVEGSESVVACIRDPLRNETFTAIRGRGARLGETPLAVTRRPTLDGAAVGVGVSHRVDRREETHAVLPALYPAVRLLRVSGSAALDLAYVAAGRLDAVWYVSLGTWDVAAGRLLVSEAGGAVTGLSGAPLIEPDRQGVLATNGALHAAMLDTLHRNPPS